MTSMEAKIRCAVLVAVGAALIALLLSLRADVIELPRLAVETRGTLLAEVQITRHELLAEVDRQITALRLETLQRVDVLSKIVDHRTAETLQIADFRLSAAQNSIDGLRADLRPVLTHAASVTAHADEAAAVLFRRDALPAQTLGLIAAAKVTAGETAQTMKIVRETVPKLAASAVGAGRSADGIAADVHAITSDIAKPKGFWTKMRTWLETAGKVAARFL